MPGVASLDKSNVSPSLIFRLSVAIDTFATMPSPSRPPAIQNTASCGVEVYSHLKGGPEKKPLLSGTKAAPSTRHPKVLAPVCVAGGKSDNWSTGSFLQEDAKSVRLSKNSKNEYKVFTGYGFCISV